MEGVCGAEGEQGEEGGEGVASSYKCEYEGLRVGREGKKYPGGCVGLRLGVRGLLYRASRFRGAFSRLSRRRWSRNKFRDRCQRRLILRLLRFRSRARSDRSRA